MRAFLFLLISFGSLTFTQEVKSQQTVAITSGQPIRYNPVVAPYYRHCEDVRRYNAKPNPKGYRGCQASKPHYSTTQHCSYVTAPPVKLRTEVVSETYEELVCYDKNGCRKVRFVTLTVYKDIYSNGGCRIRQKVSKS